jgi:hypothetical protein
MQQTLEVDSIACRESALHDPGHWKMYDPEQVIEIIDQFLEKHSGVRPELHDYALTAREGMVQ